MIKWISQWSFIQQIWQDRAKNNQMLRKNPLLFKIGFEIKYFFDFERENIELKNNSVSIRILPKEQNATNVKILVIQTAKLYIIALLMLKVVVLLALDPIM